MSALERLRADVEGVAQALAVGRAALPRLAMGTDAEGLVHVGMDQRGAVVRLDLDPQWRATLPTDGLGSAVSDALQQAAQVRTGDWAAAVAASYPGPRSTDRTAGHTQRMPRAAQATGRPIQISRDARGPVVTIAAGWSAEADDVAVRDALLAALTMPPAVSSRASSARPAEVRELAQRTREDLIDSTEALPRFMRSPIQDSVERVHDGVSHALSLPLASEGIASGELGTYAAALHECLWLIDRPLGCPRRRRRGQHPQQA